MASKFVPMANSKESYLNQPLKSQRYEAREKGILISNTFSNFNNFIISHIYQQSILAKYKHISLQNISLLFAHLLFSLIFSTCRPPGFPSFHFHFQARLFFLLIFIFPFFHTFTINTFDNSISFSLSSTFIISILFILQVSQSQGVQNYFGALWERQNPNHKKFMTHFFTT